MCVGAFHFYFGYNSMTPVSGTRQMWYIASTETRFDWLFYLQTETLPIFYVFLIMRIVAREFFYKKTNSLYLQNVA